MRGTLEIVTGPVIRPSAAIHWPASARAERAAEGRRARWVHLLCACAHVPKHAVHFRLFRPPSLPPAPCKPAGRTHMQNFPAIPPRRCAQCRRDGSIPGQARATRRPRRGQVEPLRRDSGPREVRSIPALRVGGRLRDPYRLRHARRRRRHPACGSIPCRILLKAECGVPRVPRAEAAGARAAAGAASA